jgi:outer membrane protein assembly factor BamB/DNA-binding SARP family transcriptional activator
MTSLKGNLNSVDLANIFQMLTLNQREGTLYIFEGASRKAIYFGHDGVSMLSKGRSKTDALGRILLRYDRLTPEQLATAIEKQNERGRLLGQVLVEESICSRADIDEALQIQIQEEVYSLFIWKDAQFEFIEGEPDAEFRSEGIQKLTFNVNSVIMEAARRVDEWEWIQTLVPDASEVFRYTSLNVPLTDSIFQEPYAGKVLAAIDGKRSAEEVIAASYVNKFEVSKVLAILLDGGAIEKLPVPELRREADEAVAAGDTRAAVKFLSRLVAVKGDTPEMHEQLAKAFERENEIADAARHYAVFADIRAAAGAKTEAFQIYRRICEMLPTDLAAADRMIEIFATHPEGIEHHAKEMISKAKHLAEIYVELKRSSRAIQVLHRAVSLGPDDPDLRNRLIAVYLASGMTNEAIAEYEALAETALAMNDEETAEKIFRKILAVDRHREDVVRRLDEILSKKRRRRQNMKSLAIGGCLIAVLGVAASLGLTWYKRKKNEQRQRETESAARLDAVRVTASPLRAEMDLLLKEVGINRPTDLRQLAASLKRWQPKIADQQAQAAAAVKALNEMRNEYQGLPADDDALALVNELSGRGASLTKNVADIQRSLRESAELALEQAQQMLANTEPTRAILAKVDLAAEIASDCDNWLATTEKGAACRDLRQQLRSYIDKFERTKREVEEKVQDNDAEGAYTLAIDYLTDSDFPPNDLRTEMPVPVRIETSPPGAQILTKDGVPTGQLTGPSCIVTISMVKGASFDFELQGFKKATLTIPPVAEVSPALIKDKVKRRHTVLLEKTQAFKKTTSDGRAVTAPPFASSRIAVIPSSRACDVVDLERRTVAFTLQLNGDRTVRASGVILQQEDGGSTIVVPTGDGALMFFEGTSGRPLGSWADSRGGLVFDLALAGGDVIAADDRGGLYCVNVASRQKRWSYATISPAGDPTNVAAEPVVAGGELYVPCADGTVHVVSLQDGRRVRVISASPAAEGGRMSSGAAVHDGSVYFTTHESSKQTRVTKADVQTGRVEWSVVVAGDVRSAPMPFDGTVYLVTVGGTAVGLKTLDGSATFTTEIDRSVKVLGDASLAGGVLYVGCDNGMLYAFDVHGRELRPLWKFPVRSGTDKPVAITTRCVLAGGLILFGAADNSVYALDGGR